MCHGGIIIYHSPKFTENRMRQHPFTLEEVTLLMQLIDGRRKAIRGMSLHEDVILRRLYQRFDRMTAVL